MNPIEDLEKELRRAFEREPAPHGFADRLTAKIPSHRKVSFPLWRRPFTFALAAGLIVAAIVPVAVSEYRQRQTVRGQEASRELILALDVTRVKLQQTRARIQRSARHIL